MRRNIGRLRSIGELVLCLAFTAGLVTAVVLQRPADAATYGRTGGSGASASATDPVSVMLGYCQAAGKGLGTPVDFSATTAYVEDFALGALTVATSTGGTGAVSYSTNATNLGSHGIVKVASAVNSSDFAYASSVNTNGFITNMTTATYCLTYQVTLVGAMTGNFSMHAVGIVGAAALSGNSTFVGIGAVSNGASQATNWGFGTWNGAASTFHNGGVAFSLGAQHYVTMLHDATTHTFFMFVDTVQVDSMSDVTMNGVGAASWFVGDQGTTSGSTQVDKLTMQVI